MRIAIPSLTHRFQNIGRDGVAVLVLIVVHTCLLGYSAMWMSPTLDEPAHM